MSHPVQISSASEFNSLLASSKILVADFYTDWCGPCKTIAPLYAQLAAQLSRPKKITFVKVNGETVGDVAQTYGVSAYPTFIIFKNQQIVERIQGASPKKLQEAVKKLAAEADSDGAGGFSAAGGSGSWTALIPPKGFNNVTDQVDARGLDLLNSSSDCGTAKTLFDGSRPSSLGASGKGKEMGKTNGDQAGKDWVESDTDEQLMLYVPFMSTLKIHSLQITSLPPASSEDDDEIPMRPKTMQIYSNRANVLGFDEAEGLQATQSITLNSTDWDEKSGTAKLELRFVKFQNVHSLVLFVVDGEGSGEKVRIDRIRVVGETGEKREMGKLEKVGEHDH